MKKSVLSLAAVAVLSISLGSQANAQDVKVKDGDTLWGLSQTHQVSVEDIMTWNGLETARIHTGDILKVSNEKYYTIKSGDTLWNIAKTNGVTVNDIKEWNGIESDLIYPDNQIVILDSISQAPVQSEAIQQPRTAEVPEAQPKKQSASTAATKPVVKQAAKTDANTESIEKEITVTATAYTASCNGCSGITATGINLKNNPDTKVISVDPSVIPLGSKVYVEGYGYAVAGDTGGAIKGNKIDVFVPDLQDAKNWGRKNVKVKVLN
ncbi:LysM peptidoglycan-binding and 3D domain-containing protein [Peribacillus huizhouensis]|uniref:3D (Asp-Asp-Asp) domain-containing protein n=1 Tax=Peribacillus huizhouensis TaxID=1501239 RepID=A0ABR6CVG5_9BACI|nr:3D domain-containing protein [Peribacillus huizhouensis]MBA9028959.1 3D (Asp-Asp-Asp) domain-containing protein [Peribacillus huizhouensis]